MSAVIENHHDDHHHGPDKGLMRWVLTTNHKDIGSLYLWFSFAMFLVGGCMALVIRAELFQPGLQISRARIFQSNDHHARVNYGLWCRDACICRPCQLAGTDDDWRAGHGAAPDEQLQLLDPSVCFRNAH